MALDIISNPKAKGTLLLYYDDYYYVRGKDTGTLYAIIRDTWRPCTSKCLPLSQCTQHLVGGTSLNGGRIVHAICALNNNILTHLPDEDDDDEDNHDGYEDEDDE